MFNKPWTLLHDYPWLRFCHSECACCRWCELVDQKLLKPTGPRASNFSNILATWSKLLNVKAWHHCTHVKKTCNNNWCCMHSRRFSARVAPSDGKLSTPKMAVLASVATGREHQQIIVLRPTYDEISIWNVVLRTHVTSLIWLHCKCNAHMKKACCCANAILLKFDMPIHIHERNNCAKF